MVQIVISQDSYTKRSAREGLTEQEEWALVAHVKERTQLLKRKKEGLTLEEKSNGKPIESLRWKRSIVEVLQTLVAEDEQTEAA